jgi:ribosomal protein S18 acetylase RimI-like enzyme
MRHIVPDRDIRFRPGSPDDAQAMAEIAARCDASDHSWAHAGWAPRPDQPELDTPLLAGRIADPDHWAEVATRDGALVGFAMVRPAAVPGRGHLSNLFVDPAEQGRGIGGALLAHAVGEIRARGCGEAELSCQLGNARSRAIYERAGWRATGARHVNEDGIEMVQYLLAL